MCVMRSAGEDACENVEKYLGRSSRSSLEKGGIKITGDGIKTTPGPSSKDIAMWDKRSGVFGG